MKYYLELRINEFIDPNSLDVVIRKPLDELLGDIGSVSLAVPEYQFYQSSKGELLELKLDEKVLYFKYIKVSILLTGFTKGIELINLFLLENNLAKKSKLLFADQRYNLLELDFLGSKDSPS